MKDRCIPAPKPETMIGSLAEDSDCGPGEERRPAGLDHSFFVAATKVTNGMPTEEEWGMCCNFGGRRLVA
jgi:hypothetical protein